MADPRVPPEKFKLHQEELRRLSSVRLEVARLVLVEGWSRTEAGAHFKMTKQGVQQAIKKVLDIVQSDTGGWVEVHTFAPKELAERFLEDISKYSETKK